MKIVTDKKRIDAIFNRGIIVEILPSKDALLKKLYAGERLRIFIGADPTSNALHLSHAKNYMLLEELRQLGHEVIVLFGDFTAQIGDPTDRSDTRPQLSAQQVKANVKSWIAQIKPLMNFADKTNPPKVLYNSSWLAKLSFKDVVELAANFTVQQMIERDMFEKRWDKNIPIHLHEFLYPLMQGYDSVAMDVDVEMCGTDQIFNALAGRTLLKRLKNKEKSVMAVNLMENPKTGELMSKSKGTGVFLSNTASEMFGAIMAQPDEMIDVLYINNTRLPLADKARFLQQGPRAAKAQVAFEITKIFHGTAKAKKAQTDFDQTFRQKGTPTELPEVHLKKRSLADALLAAKFVASKSEWRRLVTEGAVRTMGGDKISDPAFQPQKTTTLKIGKRRFVKIIL